MLNALLICMSDYNTPEIITVGNGFQVSYKGKLSATFNTMIDAIRMATRMVMIYGR